MTTDLEKHFFDTFGIEERYFEHFHGDGYDYPQITDHILLELENIFVHAEIDDSGFFWRFSYS